MRVITVNEGSQKPILNAIFENAIGDTNPAYSRTSVPTENRSDELSISAYKLYDYGSVLMDLTDVEFEKCTREDGSVYFHGKVCGVDMHVTNMKPVNGMMQVNAELRVRTSHPINRPSTAKQPSMSYGLVLELTTTTAPANQMVVVETSSTWEKALLDTTREIFAAYGKCVKRVPLGTKARGAASHQPRRGHRVDVHHGPGWEGR
jgi:hypothetical protein